MQKTAKQINQEAGVGEVNLYPRVSPLSDIEKRVRQEVGSYLKDKKSHGHLNRTVIEYVIERLCKGESLDD